MKSRKHGSRSKRPVASNSRPDGGTNHVGEAGIAHGKKFNEPVLAVIHSSDDFLFRQSPGQQQADSTGNILEVGQFATYPFPAILQHRIVSAEERFKIVLQHNLQGLDLLIDFFIGPEKLDSVSQVKVAGKKPAVLHFQVNGMILRRYLGVESLFVDDLHIKCLSPLKTPWEIECGPDPWTSVLPFGVYLR